MINQIHQLDCQEGMRLMEEDSVDLIVTDPPYGYKFMGKDWDRAVPHVEVWQECLRVLKPGAFLMCMSAPRQDVLSHMIVNLGDAGFETGFTSIYWTYASGFPKASNISKMVDKRAGRIGKNVKEIKDLIRSYFDKSQLILKELNNLCGFEASGYLRKSSTWESVLPSFDKWIIIKSVLNIDDKYDDIFREAEREIIGKEKCGKTAMMGGLNNKETNNGSYNITTSTTTQAQELEGCFGGFQPKPAVEIILIAMKPLTEKTYVDQALSNGHGVTWLDDARIPYQSTNDKETAKVRHKEEGFGASEIYGDGIVPKEDRRNGYGRFPANLLVTDDLLGDNSRYFSLDAWWQTNITNLPESVLRTFPFLLVPKASKTEKNRGCEQLPPKQPMTGVYGPTDFPDRIENGKATNPRTATPKNNNHPTVKPLKLMTYLITLGSRPDDLVLDPYAGSGTTLIAAKLLNRNYVGFELEPEYKSIADHRLQAYNPEPESITLMDYAK